MCVAPRDLKEPVSWRFSAFSRTGAPTRRDSSPADSTGVSRTKPARARAASSTSANVTASSGATATPWDYGRMSTVDETVRLLAATEVFGEVEPRELEEVARVAVPRHWDRGEVIFREGDVGDTCYLLRTGAILLTREHQDGRMVALAELRAGMLFGELAMFRGERRSATAEVVEPASALALLATDMQRLIRRNPDLALKLLANLAERVSRTNERLLQQSFQTVAGRVASALLAQTTTRQADGAPDSDVLIRSTQAEIAHLAGTSRESCSRFLATLERAGIVTLGRGKVTVHDPARLRNYIH
jgi:CRP/FNR family transcriptional regulator, cyclic AMP receptor protein